jgi:hypothetical protein
MDGSRLWHAKGSAVLASFSPKDAVFEDVGLAFHHVEVLC